MSSNDNTQGATPPKPAIGSRRRALLRDITRKKLTFTLCAAHYEHLALSLSVPTIVITALSGFVSFLGASDVLPVEYRVYISLGVGLMATVATILGGMAQQFKYASRAEAFCSASQSYGILEQQVKYIYSLFCSVYFINIILTSYSSIFSIIFLQQLEFSIRANIGKRMNDAFYNKVETQILDISKSMKYFPPQHKVKSWQKKGLIEALEDQVPLPTYLTPWFAQLKALGVLEGKDMVFLTKQQITNFKPPMPEVVVQKILAAALTEQIDQGMWGHDGEVPEDHDLFKMLSPHAKKRLSLDHSAKKESSDNLLKSTKVTPVDL